MKGRATVLVLLLVVSTALAYLPVWRNGFVNLDDGLYVTQNAQVTAGLSPRTIAWAFTSVRPWSWHPLTWISHLTDVTLFGLDPRGHHGTSLLLHVANSLLLFTLLRAMTGWLWRGIAVAALLALHPIHVETVAWVAERKGVLSSFFFLLALLAYRGYARRPGLPRYALVAAAVLASLMAKQMAITIPAVLLVLDYWPLGRLAGSGGKSGARLRFRTLLIEKIPLVLLALGGAGVAYVAQARSGAVMQLTVFPLSQRLGNAAVSYLAYLGKAAWPAQLACFYPHAGSSLSLVKAGGAAAVVAAATLLAIVARRRRPWFLAGWLWYLLTLLPVIGIVQLGWHAMADRYGYLPLIGVYFVVAAAAGEFAAARIRRRVIAALGIATVLLALGVTTWRQAGVWRDDLTLFQHAIDVTEGNWFAHSNLGEAYAKRGELGPAMVHFREAIRLNRAFAIRQPGR